MSDQVSALARAEAEVSAARLVLSGITSRARLAKARAEKLRRAKGPKALAAATGDQAAREALAKANESLLRAGLEFEDLTEAEAQAAAKVAEAEAALAGLRDRERADQVEHLAGQLADSAAAVDMAMRDLAAALVRRDQAAQALMALLPGGFVRDVSHRLAWGPVVRAARAAGLAQWLRMPHYEAHHCVPLQSMFPMPEIAEAVAKLRGKSAQKREAA